MELRNIALIAHVDHGKTTLVDSMFRAAGAIRANQRIAEARARLGRPGTRARHHHPRQMHRRGLARNQDQHRRYPGSRRFRRRGGAYPVDGGRRAAAGRRRRRPHAANQVRSRQGARARARADRGDQQGGPPRRPAACGRRRGVRSVRRARRRRAAARFPHPLRLRPGGLGGARARRAQGRDGAAVRHHTERRRAAASRSRRRLRHARQHPRIRCPSRPGADRAHRARHGRGQHAGDRAQPRRRHRGAVPHDQAVDLQRACPRARATGLRRRHRGDRRAKDRDRRRYRRRGGAPGRALRIAGRSADACHAVHHQRFAAGRKRRRQGDLAPAARPPVPRGRKQRRHRPERH